MKAHGRFSAYILGLCVLSAPLYDAVAQARPQPKDLYEQALSFMSAGDTYKAADALREAVRLNPAYADAWGALAQCQYDIREYERAVSFIDEALKYGPRTHKLVTLRGFCYIALGKLNDARPLFDETLAVRPNDTDARFGLALLDVRSGKSANAKARLSETLKASPSDPKALLSLAFIARAEGRDKESETLLREALRWVSGDANVYYAAAVLSSEQGRATEAARLAQLAMDANSHHAAARSLLASLYYSRGQYDDARSILDASIRRNREDAEAWFVLGRVEEAAGHFDDARYAFSALCDMRPDDEIARLALENLVMTNTGFEDPMRADYAAWRFARAADFERRYLYEKAVAEYRRGLELDPYANKGRRRYAELLRMAGLPSTYLSELRFLNDIGKADQALDDAIEIYTSVLAYSVARDWKLPPVFSASKPYRIAVYAGNSGSGYVHIGSDMVLAEYIRSALTFEHGLMPEKRALRMPSLAEAQKQARNSENDYFMLLNQLETERDIIITAELRVAKTGALVARVTAARSGNERIAMAVQHIVRAVRKALPVRGMLVARSGERALVDMGRVNGIQKDDTLLVIKNGAVSIKSDGAGLLWNDADVVAKITVRRVDDELFEGILLPSGFYDRINSRDIVVPESAKTFRPDTENAAEQSANYASSLVFDRMSMLY